MEFLTSSYNETSAMNSVRGHRSPDSRLFSATSAWSPDQRPSTGKPIQRSQSVQSLNRHYPTATPSPSPRDILTTQAQSTPRSSRHPQLQAPTSPIARKPKQTLKTAHRLRQKKDLRTAPSLDNSEQGMTNNYLNENVRTLLGTYDEPDNLKVPMRAGYNTGEEGSQETDISHSLNYNTSSNIQHNAVPRLDLTQVSYSHRGRPSVRMNDSADFQANLWWVLILMCVPLFNLRHMPPVFTSPSEIERFRHRKIPEFVSSPRSQSKSWNPGHPGGTPLYKPYTGMCRPNGWGFWTFLA